MTKKVVETPADESAERHLLGGLINKWTSFSDISSFSEDLFYDIRHRLIFNVMLGFWREQQTPTIKDIWRTLESEGHAGRFQGFQYLLDMQQDALGLSMGTALKACVTAYQQRCLLAVADKIIDDLREQPSQELINQVTGDLARIYTNVQDKTHTLTEVLEGVEGRPPLIDVVKQERDDLLEHGIIPMAGPSIGIKSIDKLTRGLVPGSLFGVGAATGVGKSDFLARMIFNLISADVPHMVFTLEMSTTEYAARLQAIAASVAPGAYLSREMDDIQFNQVVANDGLLRQKGHLCIINGNSSCLPEEVAMKVKREMVKLPIQVVIIDHLGLLSNSDPKANDYQRMGHSSRLLKRLAQELNICVVEAAQFNRSESPYGPTMNSFRDSGKVGEDMDTAILIHRPNKEKAQNQAESQHSTDTKRGVSDYPYNEDEDQSVPVDDYIQIKVAKNRTGGGRLGSFEFDFNKRTGEWVPRDSVQTMIQKANR